MIRDSAYTYATVLNREMKINRLHTFASVWESYKDQVASSAVLINREICSVFSLLLLDMNPPLAAFSSFSKVISHHPHPEYHSRKLLHMLQLQYLKT